MRVSMSLTQSSGRSKPKFNIKAGISTALASVNQQLHTTTAIMQHSQRSIHNPLTKVTVGSQAEVEAGWWHDEKSTVRNSTPPTSWHHVYDSESSSKPKQEVTTEIQELHSSNLTPQERAVDPLSRVINVDAIGCKLSLIHSAPSLQIYVKLAMKPTNHNCLELQW
jgi:hypothetical protein